MRKLLIIALTLISTNAYAQLPADPCGPDISTARVASGVQVTADLAMPLDANVMQVAIYQDGVRRTVSVTQMGVVGSCGLITYRIPLGQFAQGNYKLEFAAMNLDAFGGPQEGPKFGNPLQLEVVTVVPLPPAPRPKRAG